MCFGGVYAYVRVSLALLVAIGTRALPCRSGGDNSAQKQMQQRLPRKDGAGSVGMSFLGVQLAAADAERSLRIEQFAAVAKTLCGLPSFAAAPLFRRIRCILFIIGIVNEEVVQYCS